MIFYNNSVQIGQACKKPLWRFVSGIFCLQKHCLWKNMFVKIGKHHVEFRKHHVVNKFLFCCWILYKENCRVSWYLLENGTAQCQLKYYFKVFFIFYIDLLKSCKLHILVDIEKFLFYLRTNSLHILMFVWISVGKK